MVKMTKYDLKPIVKTYYDALEEGTILGRKCTRCGHIEFPPYLCCNECGGLDTEWVDLTNMRGIVKQALPTKGAFGDPEFRNTQGDYFAVEIEVPGMDPFNASLLHVDYDKYEEFDQYIQEHEVEVKPLLFQDEDMKVVAWELVEDNGFKKIPEIKAPEPKKEETKTATATAAVDLSNDATTQTVIEAAADAYGVDVASITLATDIREDLSNESMKMIVMISTIEDQLNVTIEIQEASNLNTIADFVNVVKERLGEETIASNAPTANNSATATAAQSSEELDDVAKTVIEAAADAYGVDASSITLATDIREDLSNESMKMIVMISTIEDQLNVTIEIQEASNLNTIADFVNVVKERLGEETIASNAPTANNSATATAAQSSEELDDVAKTVIEAAADAYGVDASSITLATDIREDLSNESMKMIVMISTIEDQLNVTIEIQEASNLNTIGDFVSVVRERL